MCHQKDGEIGTVEILPADLPSGLWLEGSTTSITPVIMAGGLGQFSNLRTRVATKKIIPLDTETNRGELRYIWYKETDR